LLSTLSSPHCWVGQVDSELAAAKQCMLHARVKRDRERSERRRAREEAGRVTNPQLLRDFQVQTVRFSWVDAG
jgi:hypothetical protein